MKLFSHRRGVSPLSRLQDKLAEIVLVKRPMCFGGLIKIACGSGIPSYDLASMPNGGSGMGSTPLG